METEILDVTQCEAQKPRSKTVAILAPTLAKKFLAEVLAHFTFLLAERGWDITVITDNRQSFADFLIDERAKRVSLDKIYCKAGQRQELLRKFMEANDHIDNYLIWNVQTDTFLTDFQVIKEAGKAVFVSFWNAMDSLTSKSVKRRAEMMDCLAASTATISAFPLDSRINNAVYIPFLHPYFPEDLSRVQLGEKELLLLTVGASARTVVVAQNFASLVETDPAFRDKVLRIVPINKKLNKKTVRILAEMAEAHPENIILEALCEKPHKILDGNAGVILVDNNQEQPKMLSVAVAKGMPTLFVKGYSDYSIQDFNKGFRICHSNNTEKLNDELKRFFDPKVNAKRAAATLRAVGKPMKDEIMDCWENVLLGNPVKEYQFVTEEHVLLCCLSHMKNLNQKQLQRFDAAAKYNTYPAVKKAKKKVARMKRKKYLSLAWIWLEIKKSYYNAIERFHIWERNKRFDYSFIELDTPTRRKMQLLIMKMYVEFERICRELNLRYYVAGGTLLGAVRHKGFIPWDDDLDVVMPRKDYDTFLKCAPALLKDGIGLNANAYPYSFSRMEVEGTHMTAPFKKQKRKVFLDVLPLDCACEDEKLRIKHEKRNKQLMFRMYEEARKIPQLYWKNREVIIRRIFLKLFSSHKAVNRKWTKNAKKYYSEDAKNWLCMCGEYGYEGEVFPKEYWGEPIMMEFEGLQVPCMREYDAYLSAHYGDYMQVPPVSQRGMKHNIYSMTLGRYDNMSVEEVAKELSDDYFASTGKRVSFLK